MFPQVLHHGAGMTARGAEMMGRDRGMTAWCSGPLIQNWGYYYANASSLKSSLTNLTPVWACSTPDTVLPLMPWSILSPAWRLTPWPNPREPLSTAATSPSPTAQAFPDLIRNWGYVSPKEIIGSSRGTFPLTRKDDGDASVRFYQRTLNLLAGDGDCSQIKRRAVVLR